MANTAELETLVIRLQAEVDGFRQNMQSVERETASTAQEVEKQSSKIEGFAESVKGFAAGAVAALESLSASNFLSGTLDAYSEAEQAGIKLSSTLKAQGRDVEALGKEYQAFASEMQNATSLSDELFLNMLEQAEGFKLTGDAAKNAVRSAIGLAKGNGQAASSMLRLTAAYEQGNIKTAMMFARMVPQLRGIRNESEFVARYQNLVAAGMEAASRSSQTASGRLKLLNETWGDFKEQLGETVAGLVKPIADIGIKAVLAFQELSPEIKRTIVFVLGLTAAVAGLTVAVKVLGIVWSLVTVGTFIIVGAIVAAGVALASWVASLGGVEAAWEKVKGAGLRAWAWVAPVRRAVLSFFGAVRDYGTQAWGWVERKATKVWNSISGSATVNWNKIKEYVLDAIIAGEFALRNFEDIATLAWLGVKIGAVSAFGEIKHFFTGTMPALFKWFGDNWRTMFMQASLFAVNAMMKLTGVMGKVLIGDISGALRDAKNLPAQLAADAANAINAIPPIKLPERQMGALEKQWREEFAALGSKLATDWATFRSQKLAEFAKNPVAEEDKQKLEEGGKKVGSEVNKAAQGEMGKNEGILARSAEGLSRIRAQASGSNTPAEKQLNESKRQTGLLTDIRNRLDEKEEMEALGL